MNRNDVVARAKELKHVPHHAQLRGIVVHWLHLAAAFAVFYIWPTWWVYIPVLLFVSARQYGLVLMLHDAQHTLLHPKKRLNDWMGTWLLAAPLGTEFKSSQETHLGHHFHLGSSDRDPDYALYCFGEPSPKQSAWQLATLFLAKLMGGKVLLILRNADRAELGGKVATAAEQGRVRQLVARLGGLGYRFWPVAVAQAVLLAIFTVTFGWYGYILLWALPVATLAAFYNDFRIFCEHSLIGRDALHKDERMTSFISNPLERFFLAPNHMNYHAEHHLFPYVPHVNLPALRKAVMACPELRDNIEWRPSYLGHFLAYVRALRPASGAADASADKQPGAVAT